MRLNKFSADVKLKTQSKSKRVGYCQPTTRGKLEFLARHDCRRWLEVRLPGKFDAGDYFIDEGIQRTTLGEEREITRGRTQKRARDRGQRNSRD